MGAFLVRWWWRRLWDRITEPRLLSTIYGGVHTITLLTGIVTLLVPPVTISGHLGPALTIAWSLCFVLGGSVGIIAALPGYWLWERWACWFALLGIGIYGYVIATLHFTATGSRLTQLGVLLLAATVFIVRLALIWGRSYAPRR